MNCARCGNALHRLPMFDLPRKVKEFSCLCCGERFWTIQGETTLLAEHEVAQATKAAAAKVEFTQVTHRN